MTLVVLITKNFEKKYTSNKETSCFASSSSLLHLRPLGHTQMCKTNCPFSLSGIYKDPRNVTK